MHLQHPPEVDERDARYMGQALLGLAGERLAKFIGAYREFTQQPRSIVEEFSDSGLIRRLLRFPALDAQVLDRFPVRRRWAALIELRDDKVFLVEVDRLSNNNAQFLRTLGERLASAPPPTDGWLKYSGDLSYFLEKSVRVFNARFADPTAQEWDVRQAALAWCLACVDKALLWSKAKNLSEVHAYFHAVVAHEFGRELDAFMATLPAEVLDAARNTGGLNVSAYNYLVGTNCVTRRNRMQAVRLYPLFRGALAGDTSSWPDIASLSTAIDEGKPFVDAGARLFGAPRSAIRGLAGQKPEVVHTKWSANLGVLTWALSCVAPEQRPRTPADWNAFNDALQLIRQLSRRPLPSDFARAWLRELAGQGFRKLARYVEHRNQIAQAVHGVEDFMAALREVLESDAMRLPEAPLDADAAVQDILDRAYMDAGLLQVMDAAQRWHAAFLGSQKTALKERGLPNESWGSVLERPYQCANGVSIVALKSTRDLLEEGTAQQNCVGSYASACLNGDCYVFSIRESTGKRLSTLELRIDADASALEAGIPVIRIAQHTGHENSAPPEASTKAACEFLDYLQSGAADEALKRVLRERERNRRRKARQVMQELGEPLATLRASLKKSLRGPLSYEQLLRSLAEHAATTNPRDARVQA